MLTKNQRLIYALAELKTIVGDYEFETKVKDNETGEVDIVDCYKEIETLIVEFINPQPYKFEELKPNMWVWDNKLNACFLIKELKPQSYWNIIIYANYLTDTFEEINFEKNRFYSVTMALKREV